jgi:hypothetical protein
MDEAPLPVRVETPASLAAPSPSGPDLETKLPRRLATEMLRELRQQLGLSELELLGPDRAIDLELENAATDPERSTVGSDLGADDLLPVCADPMGQSHAVETEVSEHLTDQVPDRLEAALAPPAPAATPPPTIHRSLSRWSRKTMPVGILG